MKLRVVTIYRDGIGAQSNDRTSSLGYAFSSHFGARFGLSQAHVVSRVEVLWPSGIRQALTNEAVNRVAEVRETVL